MIALKSYIQDVIKEIKTISVISKFENEWIKLMSNIGAYNLEKETFGLNYTTITPYGYYSEVYIPDGFDLANLEELTTRIENKFKCILMLNKRVRSNIVDAFFITHYRNDIHYKPLLNEVSPTNIYIGNDQLGNPIIIDMIVNPHILLSGSTRSGKSKLLDILITNLCYSCSPEEVNFALFQVDKHDFLLYRNLPHVKLFAKNDIDEILKCLQKIDEELNRRIPLVSSIKEKGRGSNFDDYNKIKGKTIIKPLYVAFDEAGSIYDLKGCSAKEKDKKESIVKIIKRIISMGAALGVYMITSLQRPSADNLNPTVKGLSNVTISFKQVNAKSSEIAIDDPDKAINLVQREFIYKVGDYKFGVVPYIYDNEIYEYLYNHKTA